jgi:hypothetical protein
MKKQMSLFKKKMWNTFISGIDYRTDGPKAYRLLNSLTCKQSTKQSQPLKVSNKEVMDKTEMQERCTEPFTLHSTN